MLDRSKNLELEGVSIVDFIREMKYAYAAADVVISRAGALSIAELTLTGKASILVPSPNVAEDHQRKNAESLTAKNAAIMVKDADAKEKMIQEAIDLVGDHSKRKEFEENIKSLAKPNAAMDIAEEIIKLVA